MRRPAIWLVCVAILCGAATPASGQQAGGFRKVVRHALPGLSAIRRDPGDTAGDHLIAVTRDGRRFRIRDQGNGIGLVLIESAPGPAPREPRMLPDGVISHGTGNIRRALLIRPTRRYGHGVLGDKLEAEGVRVETASGASLEYVLSADSVFEDRHARIADIDGDGGDEVLVVRSYLDAGAALAALSATGGRLRIVAESAPLGIPYRWLNPVGVGDFNGDGRTEIAVVTTPHIGGILRFYRREGARLREIWRESGFSNHAMGSRELGLSAILDTDDDGIPEIVLPSADRRSLRVVGFAGGRFHDRGGPRHGASIATALHVADLDGNRRDDLVYGLSDGTLVIAYR